MEIREALGILGVREGVTLEDVRVAYRAQLRRHHPDTAGTTAPGTPGAAERTRSIIEAHALLVATIEASPTGTLALAPDPSAGAAAGRSTIEHETVDRASVDHPTGTPRPATMDEAALEHDLAIALGDDTIAVAAPAGEAYAALYEAAATIGEIAYNDRQAGLLEIIVRFEGGPSCSVVLSLQGRALYTEVFATMESIEAAPTPPLAPVLDALVPALRDELT